MTNRHDGAGDVQQVRRRGPRPLLALAAGCGLLAACGDEVTSRPPDLSPPTVTIVQPAENDELRTATPSFLVRVSDGDQVFVPSLVVTIDGVNFSETFANGYNAATGEIRVTSGVRLEDGLQTMIVRVSDRSGNTGEDRVQFSVNSTAPPPPPPT